MILARFVTWLPVMDELPKPQHRARPFHGRVKPLLFLPANTYIWLVLGVADAVFNGVSAVVFQ